MFVMYLSFCPVQFLQSQVLFVALHMLATEKAMLGVIICGSFPTVDAIHGHLAVIATIKDCYACDTAITADN